MCRRSGVLFALTLIRTLGAAAPSLSQCNNQITLVPLRAMKAASKARDFIRFRYALSGSDSVLLRSHEDTETTIGPYDTGFVITRNEKVLQNVVLGNLPEFHREDPAFAESFGTLAVTRACRNGGPIYFVTMQYFGDMLSPALVFILTPSAQGYVVSTLPMISGGVLDVSKDDPFHLRTWDSLNEGGCNACDTAYRISEYQIRDGKPVRTRQYRTRHVYNTGDFDDRRRIRFVP